MSQNRFGPLDSLIKGAEQTWTVTRQTVVARRKMLAGASPPTTWRTIMIAKMAGGSRRKPAS